MHCALLEKLPIGEIRTIYKFIAQGWEEGVICFLFAWCFGFVGGFWFSLLGFLFAFGFLVLFFLDKAL